MPIPGDNGQPRLERDKQNALIKEVAEHGADLKGELRFNAPTYDPKIHLDGGIYKR